MKWQEYCSVLALMVAATTAGYPYIIASVGQVWPRPQMMQSQSTYMIVRSNTFKFSITGQNCDILQKALTRYTSIMFNTPAACKRKEKGLWTKDYLFTGYLDIVEVNLLTPCETYPHHAMDEQYEIKIDSPDDPGVGTIISKSIWGVLRGLESFSQLLVPNGSAYNVNSTQIMDFPRFGYRGLLLDTSRHYLSISKILETLELMAMNKFNVFHWHIVDDPSFPYVSEVFPKLSGIGAFSPLHVFTSQNISDILEFARLRGIRVLPEFDTPGHTQSWGPAQPGLLTPCYKDDKPDGTYGPIDPTNDANYGFLTTLFTEVTKLFVDHYLHLGGDEVSFDCWQSNPNIKAFMKEQNITGNYRKLEGIYVTKVLDIVSNLPTRNGYLVWQEVFDNGVSIKNDTVVHVWKDRQDPINFKKELAKVTAAGFNTLLSSCWYLNDIAYGDDWYRYYDCDPHDFNGTDTQKKLIIGGEACMWGRYVDSTNLTPRTWPRASTVAEKLWSSAGHTNSTAEAAPRLEEHRCRLLGRGFEVEPFGPSFCKTDIDD